METPRQINNNVHKIGKKEIKNVHKIARKVISFFHTYLRNKVYLCN